jgi:hypothetical protein
VTEVYLGVGVFLVTQIGLAIWLFSKINTTVEMLVKTVDELRQELSKLLDLKAVVTGLEARFEDLLRRILHLEDP